MDKVITFLSENQETFLKKWQEFLKIKSISTDPGFKTEILRCVEFCKEYLVQIGFSNIQVFETDYHPIVYADLISDSSLPTVLFYGHYDVQPVDPIDLWVSPPFEPVIREGRMYARGASDDKGQVMLNLCAIEAFVRSGTSLPVNLKVLLEGEEEMGSPSLKTFVPEHRDLLQCDTVILSDTTMIDRNTPCITRGLKGLCYMEFEVQGASRDLHSGMYGGAVPNPIQVVCDIISRLKDSMGRVTIPGFYDKVEPLTGEEKELIKMVPFPEQEWKREIGLKEFQCEEGYTPLECLSARPTLDPNGIWGGYQGPGSKTVIPARAGAKVSMRLVPNQDPQEIADQFEEFVRSLVPPACEVSFKKLFGGYPVILDIDSPPAQAAREAMRTVFGKDPLFVRNGGTIPVVADFAITLQRPIIMMGFALDSDAMHSPNENFLLDNFFNGMKTVAWFFHYLSRQK